MPDIVVMFNNYFHDVATAVLLVSALLLIYFARAVRRHPGSEGLFLEAYHKLTRWIGLALIVIVIGGAIRLYHFGSFEWAHAVGYNQVPALIAKHILITLVLIAGVRFWLKLRTMVRELEAARREQPAAVADASDIGETPGDRP